MSKGPKARIVVAITGASGVAYGVRALELLAGEPSWEAHLVVSSSAAVTLRHELGQTVASVAALADVTYRPADVGAAIASGSFATAGMLVAPCSIKTLSSIAHCYSDNLVSRAADVTLKEGRPLVLMVRETPLHLRHLQVMTMAAEAGATVAPPVPALYTNPASVDELVEYSARRALARLGVQFSDTTEWQGLQQQGHCKLQANEQAANASTVHAGGSSP
jgi:4-hydroxy-3-polyprenylbenzoate decarboxylase